MCRSKRWNGTERNGSEWRRAQCERAASLWRGAAANESQRRAVGGLRQRQRRRQRRTDGWMETRSELAQRDVEALRLTHHLHAHEPPPAPLPEPEAQVASNLLTGRQCKTQDACGFKLGTEEEEEEHKRRVVSASVGSERALRRARARYTGVVAWRVQTVVAASKQCARTAATASASESRTERPSSTARRSQRVRSHARIA